MSLLSDLIKKKKASMRETKPKNWREKRNHKNKIAKASRRANRSR